MKSILENILLRWQERRARRQARKAGTGINIPKALSEFEKRAAYAKVQRELKDSRGRW